MTAMGWFTLAFAAVWPPVLALMIHLSLRGPTSAFFVAWMGGCTAGLIVWLFGNRLYGAGSVLSAIACGAPLASSATKPARPAQSSSSALVTPHSRIPGFTPYRREEVPGDRRRPRQGSAQGVV